MTTEFTSSPASTIPSYLLNSASHTILNGGSVDKSAFDGFVDIVTQGIPATLIAAGNEISNIPAVIGNFIMGDNSMAITSNRAAMMAVDSDLTHYYDDHKLGIDTAGFITAQFVPGMVGVKVLRAGQLSLNTAIGAGRFGKGYEGALGLVAPTRELHLAEAISQIGKSGNAFTIAESNLLRAFASGVGQQALEGAAWTAAVNATMHTSPILDKRDTSDLMFDVLTGAVLGGAVGGLFEGIGATWKVKKAFTAAEKEVAPWSILGVGDAPAVSLSPSSKILRLQQQIDSIPTDIPLNHPLYERVGKTAQATKETLQREIRSLTGELAGGDQKIAHITSRILDSNTFESNVANFIEAVGVSRVTKVTATDKSINKLTDKVAKALLGEDAAVEAELKSLRVQYVNAHTLDVVADMPKVLNLADHGDVVVRGKTVSAGNKLHYKQADTADLTQTKSSLEAEARYTYMEHVKPFNPTVVTPIAQSDLPMMFKALAEGNTSVVIGDEAIGSLSHLADTIKRRQAIIADDLITQGKLSIEEISKIVNVHKDALTLAAEKPELYNLRKWTRDTFNPRLGVADVYQYPSHFKIATKKSGTTDAVDGHLLEGMTIVAQQQKLYQQRADQIVAETLGEIIPGTAGMKGKPIGTETGATFAGSEAGAYGSWASFFAYVGQRVSNITKARQTVTSELLHPTLLKLAGDTTAAIEWSVLNERLRAAVQGYKLADDGTALVLMKGEEVVDTIAIKSPLVQQLAKDHIALNSGRRGQLQKIHSNNGYQDRYIEGVFYPIPRNPKDTPHFAFVVDETVQGRGHSQMIYAKDGATLEIMRNEIMTDPVLRERGIKVLTKAGSEQYYESIGKFEFERTLSDNYINNALARKGKSASFLPLTDPQRIVNNTLDWHLARDSALVRTAVEHKYATEFATLQKSSEEALNAAKSRTGYVNSTAYAEATINSPAANLIKLALNISKSGEHPWWEGVNNALESGASKLLDKMSTLLPKATSMDHLAEVNKALKEAGWKDIIDTAAVYEATNAVVPRGKLTAIVSAANNIVSFFATRSDPFNALNNAVGHSVLLGPELNYIKKNILAGNADAVAELATLMEVKVPGSAGSSIIAPSKLIAKRIGDFHTDTVGRDWMVQHGFSTTVSQQYDQVLDHVAIAISKGEEGALTKALTGLKKLGEGAEKWSGNKLVEEFNRYVAAGVMKDITDVAVRRGLMDEGLQLSFINTFVNRTQGNYLASQRPGLFHGPLGQAMGLFQTYQFNLLQQVFRYIGEGEKKNLALMMGLQGGIYGMNGLPAFNAINTHIIGNAPGNKGHLTGYEAVMSGAGKEAGEWLLYGGLSNGLSLVHPDLKLNIYNRGDINPRHLTLVPTDPSKVPIYQATERLFSNTYEGLKQVAAGADVWSTFLKGIEHNGVSRPLAGLAANLEAMGREDLKVITTSNNGRMLVSHDLLSVSSLARLAGAKPLDEAMVNDQMFRVQTYRAKDTERKEILGKAIKDTISGGGVPDSAQINKFAYEYAKSGGKQEEFAGFMAKQYKHVGASRAEELRQKLNNPYSKHMQYIMQGSEGEQE